MARAPLALLAALVALGGCGDNDPVVGLADVSVLFPLPAAPTDPGLLALDAPGRGGALLPAGLFDQVGVFAATPRPERAYGAWRIVAARLDPCFPDLALLDAGPGACVRQLRLVAQPLAAGSGGAVAVDDAMHLVYALPDADFAALARAWLQLATLESGDPTRPLGVHPTLAREGLAGPTAAALRALIAEYAGAGTLAKVTFEACDGEQWQLGAARVVGGALVSAEIPAVDPASPGGGLLQVTTDTTDGAFTIAPTSAPATALVPLAGGLGSDGGLVVDDPAALAAALQASLDLDNPSVAHLDTTDCASCHVAGRARARALADSPAAVSVMRGLSPFADPIYDLTLTVPAAIQVAPRQQRGLGYNGADPVLSQRVVNDSAAIGRVITQAIRGL